tara:strand:- start:495 stop:941 length:447 start_codon:yes stop_codon:yes gene_type:complete
MLDLIDLQNLFLILIIFMAVLKIYKKVDKEGFSDLQPANFNTRERGLILEKIYKPKNKEVDIKQTINNRKNGDLNGSTIGSYKQETNNKRFHSNPDNNKCMPSTMCMQFYSDNTSECKKNTEFIYDKNTVNSNWRNNKRVNFYSSKPL